MVKIRLNACCFCISLRRGCIGIAFFDVIVNLVIILLGPQELISQPERAVCICHCIGCVMLLLGALIQSTVLLVFYLITSFVNTAILIICFIIQTVSNLSVRFHVLIFVVVLTAINVYFYIIAYSYYQQVNTPFEEDDEA
ncbi:uncharacterized protein LOC117567220 isoform X1 [Drosophila albomicans]|uniref:Uncharacterized protein LOC117567220 isoform X1 n=1 Tax=Drosophila albomicans TaxID=7291 RepID=A0A6P8WIL9_DROAB|nr:uncharacterized protein LOC117567220 isoform X1 [Drosophila albomicans]